jgi:hypothetical protein
MADVEGKKNILALRTFADDAKSLESAPKANSELIIPKKEEYVAYEDVAETPDNSPLARISAEAAKMAQPERESFLAQKGGSAFEGDGGGDGEIIRETRHKRFRLLPAIAHSIKDWVTGQKTALEASRHPYHPIAKAEARKEVIKEAVEKSAIAPKEDFKTVVARLKKVERKPLQTGIALKEKTAIPKPKWSHTTDTRAEAPVVTPNEPTPVVSAPIPEPTPAPVIQPVSSQKESLTTPVVAPQTVLTPLVPPSEPLLPQKEAEKKAVVVPVPRTEQKRTPAPSVYKERGPRNRFLSPTFITVAVILFASIAGMSVSMLIFKKDAGTAVEKVAVYQVPSLIEGTTEGVPLLGDRGVLLEALTARLRENDTILQLYTTMEDAGGNRPASAEETLGVISPKISGSFGRTIREIAFGGAAQDPFIIMKVNSFDIAFAGMLEWEQTMSSDLSPFFGDPVVITFDPSARTDTQVREAFFKDMIASNKNARLLLDQNGSDRIIYTFVDQNTILITKNKETLDVLLPRIR